MATKPRYTIGRRAQFRRSRVPTVLDGIVSAFDVTGLSTRKAVPPLARRASTLYGYR